MALYLALLEAETAEALTAKAVVKVAKAVTKAAVRVAKAAEITVPGLADKATTVTIALVEILEIILMIVAQYVVNRLEIMDQKTLKNVFAKHLGKMVNKAVLLVAVLLAVNHLANLATAKG